MGQFLRMTRDVGNGGPHSNGSSPGVKPAFDYHARNLKTRQLLAIQVGHAISGGSRIPLQNALNLFEEYARATSNLGDASSQARMLGSINTWLFCQQTRRNHNPAEQVEIGRVKATIERLLDPRIQ